MEEKNNDKNEMSLDKLARKMSDGFGEMQKSMDARFEKFEKRLDTKLEKIATTIQGDLLNLKDEIKEVKSDTEDIKAELNKKVDKITHNDLTYRVEKLEEKFA
jgi:hypothetical protein